MDPEREVAGAEGKVDPASEQTDAPVARPREQVVPEQAAQGLEDLGVGSRMQPMASVVDVQAREFEAAGVATDSLVLFEQGHLVPAPREFVGAPEPRGPGAEDGDATHRGPGRMPVRAMRSASSPTDQTRPPESIAKIADSERFPMWMS